MQDLNGGAGPWMRQRTLIRPWIASFLDCVVSDPEIGLLVPFTAVRVGPVLLSWRPGWKFSWLGWGKAPFPTARHVRLGQPEGM